MVAALLGIIAYIGDWIASSLTLYNDAGNYAAMANGEKTCSPFWRRWLVPYVCGMGGWAWRVAQCLSAGLLAWSAAELAGTDWAAWFIVLLPGIVWLPAVCPILVDLPALALATTSAVFWHKGWYEASIIASLLAGAAKEPGPVFAAIFAGAPVLLVGLVTVRWWGAPEYEGNNEWLGKSIPELVKKNLSQPSPPDWRSASYMFKHWGAIVPLFFFGMGWDKETFLAILALLVAFGQTFIASDRTRLIQWAAPAILVVAMRAPYLPLAAALHLLTPREADA